MEAIGIWPEANENLLRKSKAWAYSLLIFILIWIPQLASVTVFWGNINATIECLSINVPVGVSIMKLVVFRYRRKVLQHLLKLVEEDWTLTWTKEEETIMMTLTKISRTISLISVIVTNALLVAYVASGVGLFTTNSDVVLETSENVEKIVVSEVAKNLLQTARTLLIQILIAVQNWNNPDVDPRLSVGFLYSVILPYDTKNMYKFVTTWIAQLAGTWFSLVAYSGPDALVAMLVLHLCGQLAIVRLNIKNIVDDACVKDPTIFHQRLGIIVERHQELNRRTEMIEDSFNTMLLAQTLVCTIILCFQAFATITTLMDQKGDDFSYLGMTIFVLHSLFFAIYTVMHLFVYCWVGDLLILESSDIGISPYESQWYLMAPAEVKALMFVTHRSRTPLQITAGKFCSFSLEMFTSIMKTSMGYLSVLLAMKDTLQK